MKSINDSYYTQMPICVISGNYILYIEHSEQGEICKLHKVLLITMPMKNGDLMRSLNKLKTKGM